MIIRCRKGFNLTARGEKIARYRFSKGNISLGKKFIETLNVASVVFAPSIDEMDKEIVLSNHKNLKEYKGTGIKF